MRTGNVVRNGWKENRWMRRELTADRRTPWKKGKAPVWVIPKAKSRGVRTLRKLSFVIEQLFVEQSRRLTLAA